MTFIKYFYLREEMKDISTENKMYHQTNASSLFDKLQRGYLQPNDFKDNLKNLKSFYSCEKGNKELCLGRKSLFTKLDTEKSKEKVLDAFPNFGGVRFEIYTDKLTKHNAVRGVKIKPIAEFPITYRKRLKERLLEIKPDISETEIEKIISTYNNFFYDPKYKDKSLSIKEGALKQVFPYLGKIDYGKFNFILKDLGTIHKSEQERESEERIEFTKKNKIDPKNELFSNYNDRLYLNTDFMKIVLLPTFMDDFFNGIAPVSFIKYYNKMKQWKGLFEQNREYKKFTQFLRDFANGKIDDETVISKVEKKKIEDYLKKSGRANFIPTVEERKEEARKYNYKTGGRKLTKEELQKEILANWKKR